MCIHTPRKRPAHRVPAHTHTHNTTPTPIRTPAPAHDNKLSNVVNSYRTSLGAGY